MTRNEQYAELQNRPFDIIGALAEMLGQDRPVQQPKQPHEPSDIPEWMRGQQMEMD